MPDKFALGAAIGQPASRINSSVVELAGKRIPTVDRPLVTKSGTILAFGRIIVKAPGQNARNNFSAVGEISATVDAMSRPLTSKLKGLSDGRPLATKIFSHAATFKPSAPRP